MFLNVTVLLQSLLLTSCPLMSHIPFLNLMAPAPRSPLFSSLLLLPGEKPRKQGSDWLCKALLTTMPAFLLRSRAARDRDPGTTAGERCCEERAGARAAERGENVSGTGRGAEKQDPEAFNLGKGSS